MPETQPPTAAHPPADHQHGSLSESARFELLGLAREAFAGEHLDDARDILEGLLLLDRRDESAWALLGRVHHAAGRSDAARDALSEALGLDDADVDTALLLARLYRDAGDATRARAIAAMSARRHTLTGEALRRAGELLGEREGTA